MPVCCCRRTNRETVRVGRTRGSRRRWAKVSDSVDGRKHKRISVFFESFERGSAAAGRRIEALEKEVEVLRERNIGLERRISTLEVTNGRFVAAEMKGKR